MLNNPQQSIKILPGSIFPLDRHDFGFHQEIGIANYTSQKIYVMTMNGQVYTLDPLRDIYSGYQRVEIRKSVQTHLTETNMHGYAGQVVNNRPYDQSIQTINLGELYNGPVIVKDMGVAVAMEKDIGYLKEHNLLDPNILLQMQYQYILASFKSGSNSYIQVMANTHDLTMNEFYISLDHKTIIPVKFDHNPMIEENIRFFFRIGPDELTAVQSKHDPKNPSKLEWTNIKASTGVNDVGTTWFYGTDREAVQALIDAEIADATEKLTRAEAEQIVNHKTRSLQLENKNLKQKIELLSADVKNEDERLEESAKRQELRSREKIAKLTMDKSENETVLQRAKLEEVLTALKEDRAKREEETRARREERRYEQQNRQMDMTMRQMQMDHERVTNQFKMEKEKSSTLATVAKSLAAIGPILLSGVLLMKNLGTGSAALAAIGGGTVAIAGGGIAGGLAIGAALGTAVCGLISVKDKIVSTFKNIGNHISRLAKRFWSWLTD